MTVEEFEEILNRMDEAQFAAFRRQFGGDSDRTRYIDQYLRDQAKFEPILCRILKVPTEADRQSGLAQRTIDIGRQEAAAAHRGNEIAEEANRISHKANVISFWACVMAGFALIVSIAAALIAAYKP